MKPMKLPLMALPENRDETTLRDAKLINGYWEKNEIGEKWANKRPGLVLQSTVSGGATGYGLYNWKGDVYSVFGTALYKNGASLGTVDATNGVYAFSSVLGATPRIFLMNGVKAYVYDAVGGLVQVTDVDYPAALVKGVVYLDGALYVMDATANIWGCNDIATLNDPLFWTALNVIVAQIEPEAAVAMAKQMVYVIAFKENSTEVFYDAANAAGSPLGPVQGAKVNFGCRHAGSVQDIDGTLCWISRNRSGSLGVMAMANVSAQIISTASISRLLQSADFTTVYSWQVSINGHQFYVVTLKNSNLTLAYDLKEHLWAQWSDTNGNYLPIVASTRDATQKVILQHESNGNLYYMSSSVYLDGADLITFDLYTPNFDGEVRYRKILSHMEITADQTEGSKLAIRYSEDDYQTWSNFRYVDLGRKRPCLEGCGSFYRRAYHFRHQSNTPLRIKTVELRMDLGTL